MKMKGDSGQAAAHRLQEIQRAAGVHVEVVERAVLGEVVRRLRGGVDDELGTETCDQVAHRRAIPDVERVVREVLRDAAQAGEVPARVAVGPEEVAPHVVVDAVDLPAAVSKNAAASEPMRPLLPVTSTRFMPTAPRRTARAVR